MKFTLRILLFVLLLLKFGFPVFGHGISDCHHGKQAGGAAWQGQVTGMFRESLEIARHCIELHKRDINEGGGPDSASALHLAAAFDQMDTVRYLVNKGAYVNIRDNAGWTPLHYAAVKGHTSICKFLILAGANPNIRDPDGRTAEDNALARGQRGCAEVLYRGR